VIDAVDLLLIHIAVQLAVECHRGFQVPPERLLDNDAPPVVLGFPQQSGLI